MKVEFRDTEVKELVVDLRHADGRVKRNAATTMREAAGRVKRNIRKAATGHRHLGQLPSTVGLSRLDAAGLAYEVGFDKRGQGNLANIIVYGSVNNAPVFSIAPSLRKEVPWLERHLSEDAEDAVLGDD